MKFLNLNFRHFLSRYAIFVLSAALILTGFYVATNKDAFADDPSSSDTQRLVTVHDSGSEVTVVTRAATVRDALQQADIVLGTHDVVEPSLDEQLVAKAYQVNIFRARPMVVIDGAREVRVMTAQQSPAKIAEAAGITLYSEDTTSFERIDDVLGSVGAGTQMVIERARVFQFTLYGKQFEARTQAKTVGELLAEKGVTLQTDDGVSPSKETSITDGMNIRVWRNGKQTITQEEAITRPIEEVKDADKAAGVREVKEEGSDGKRNVTYEIEMRDGIEVARKEIASVTTTQAVKQVIVIGTKVSLPSGSHTDWMAAAGIASSDYGYVDYIVGRESGWGVTKSNYSGSGAYGLCQALPGSKMASAGSDWATNPITQLKWCNAYAIGRYGSWAAAYNFWITKHWW